MAPINFSAITFIPGMEFTFGSFSFIAGVDGRLHVSNLEATSIGQISPDPTDHIFARSVSEPDSDRLRDSFVLPRYPFGLHNSANTFQRTFDQIMEVQAEHNMDMGEHGRMVSANRSTYDECRTINVILKPLELPNHDNESLHHVLNSPTDSESSSGSWNPTRRLYAIIGAPAEANPEAQQGDAVQQQAAEAKRLDREEEDRRALAAKGQH